MRSIFDQDYVSVVARWLRFESEVGECIEIGWIDCKMIWGLGDQWGEPDMSTFISAPETPFVSGPSPEFVSVDGGVLFLSRD